MTICFSGNRQALRRNQNILLKTIKAISNLTSSGPCDEFIGTFLGDKNKGRNILIGTGLGITTTAALAIPEIMPIEACVIMGACAFVGGVVVTANGQRLYDCYSETRQQQLNFSPKADQHTVSMGLTDDKVESSGQPQQHSDSLKPDTIRLSEDSPRSEDCEKLTIKTPAAEHNSGAI